MRNIKQHHNGLFDTARHFSAINLEIPFESFGKKYEALNLKQRIPS